MNYDPHRAILAAARLKAAIKNIEKSYQRLEKIRAESVGKPIPNFAAIQKDMKDKGHKSVLWSLDGKTPKIKFVKKTALTLRELYERQRKFRLTRRRIETAVRDNVTVTKLGISKLNPDKIVSESLTYEIKPSGKSTIARHYKHRIIRLEGSKKKFTDSKVLVSCDCVDFWNCFEYALTKRGNSQIWHSNGEPPDIRNPNYLPGLCKHLFVVAGQIIRKKL